MNSKRIKELRALCRELADKHSAAYSSNEFEGKRWPFTEEQEWLEITTEALDAVEALQEQIQAQNRRDFNMERAMMGETIDDQSAWIKELQAEITRLREALNFYATDDWHHDENEGWYNSEVQKDRGEIARKALGEE